MIGMMGLSEVPLSSSVRSQGQARCQRLLLVSQTLTARPRSMNRYKERPDVLRTNDSSLQAGHCNPPEIPTAPRVDEMEYK